jgi:glycerol-3-phosphate dehydrogenase (NAD(P)+)
MTSKRVLIIGFGEMGHAMNHLLSPRHEVQVWHRAHADEVALDLAQSAEKQDVVLFCVPTAPVFELASRIRDRLSADTLCLSIAKGLDDQARPALLALRAGLGKDTNSGVLYGPMIAEELMIDRPGFAQAGVEDREHYTRVRDLFAGSNLLLEYHDDPPGLSWCAVLKNVYAMAFGMADGLGLGDNVRGLLAVLALRELSALVGELGGKTDTPYGLAGLGDLITTATSAGSHHHELGLRLARGEREEITGEGVHSLHTIRARKLIDFEPYPLFSLIERLVREPEDLPGQWHEFLFSALPA